MNESMKHAISPSPFYGSVSDEPILWARPQMSKNLSLLWILWANHIHLWLCVSLPCYLWVYTKKAGGYWCKSPRSAGNSQVLTCGNSASKCLPPEHTAVIRLKFHLDKVQLAKPGMWPWKEQLMSMGGYAGPSRGSDSMDLLYNAWMVKDAYWSSVVPVLVRKRTRGFQSITSTDRWCCTRHCMSKALWARLQHSLALMFQQTSMLHGVLSKFYQSLRKSLH